MATPDAITREARQSGEIVRVIFLGAKLPLTKTIACRNEQFSVAPYPHVSRLTSYQEEVTTLPEFEAALRKHAALDHCLFNGQLTQPLTEESRAGKTLKNSPRHWIVFDFDKIEAKDHADAVAKYLPPECQTVSYIAQYSASMFRPSNNSLFSGHVYMLLKEVSNETQLKSYIEAMNFSLPALRAAISLTDSGLALHWPLDRSATYDSKLIYIAPPKCHGFKPAIRANDAIKLVKKKQPNLKLPIFQPIGRHEIEGEINAHRARVGLPAHDMRTRPFEDGEVLLGVERGLITDMKPMGDHYIKFNLNGGDSLGYWLDLRNPSVIKNFKGEPWMMTKEVDPDIFKVLSKTAPHAVSKPPLNPGTEILAFYTTNQNSKVKIGTFTAQPQALVLNNSTETAAKAFLAEYGLVNRGFLPHMDLIFDPQCDIQYVSGATTINTFTPTKYMQQMKSAESASTLKEIPFVINKWLTSLLGNPSPEIYNHFINWLAFIFQKREKAGTAWVWSGRTGCLTGDTVLHISRGARSGGRSITIKEAYHRWTGTKEGGKPNRAWDRSLPCRLLSAKEGLRVGYNDVVDIIDSGIKPVFKLTTTTGRTLRATGEHPFMREDGSFTRLDALAAGQQIAVHVQANRSEKHARPKRSRHVTHSIPNHPHATDHWIGDKNYKRTNTARLVVEADMNGFTLKYFVDVLRHSPIIAKSFKYLDVGLVVHHKDDNPANDTLSNLEVLTKLEHDQHHANEGNPNRPKISLETVATIDSVGDEQTYDVSMAAPHNNYVANGFVVHNTGKGSFIRYVLSPLLGPDAVVVKQYGVLKEEFNGYLERALLVVFDECDVNAVPNQSELMSKLQHWITDSPLSIRRMNTDHFEVPSYANFIFLTNKRTSVVVTSDDRRFSISDRQENKLFYTPNEMLALQRGDALEAFADVLLRWPVNSAAAHDIIKTQASEDIHEATTTINQLIAEAILRGDLQFFLDRAPSDTEAVADFHNRFNPSGLFKAQLDKYIAAAATGTPVILKDEDLFVLFRTLIPDTRYFQDSKTWRKRHYKSLGVDVDKVHRSPGEWDKKERGLKITWVLPAGVQPPMQAKNVTPIKSRKAK